MSGTVCRLCPARVGMALGIVWALGLFILALFSAWFGGYGSLWIKVMANVYHGYAPGFVGGIIGALWGFVDCFIAGWVFGFIHNWLCDRCCKEA